MKVYWDLVVLLNFAVNFSLLRATALLTGAGAKGLRLCLGAGFGALYGAACLVPGFGFLGRNLWRAVFLGLMGVFAFGMERGLFKKLAVMLVLSLALGGAAACLELRSLPMTLALVLLLLLGCRLFLRGGLHHAGQVVPASICLGGQTLRISALRDSGNTLCDPFSGQPVLLVEKGAAEKLVGEIDLRDPAGSMEQLRRTRPELSSRLIPYRALGGGGLLLAVKCDSVTVEGKPQGKYVAFSPENLFGAGKYQALTGGGQYA